MRFALGFAQVSCGRWAILPIVERPIHLPQLLWTHSRSCSCVNSGRARWCARKRFFSWIVKWWRARAMSLLRSWKRCTRANDGPHCHVGVVCEMLLCSLGVGSVENGVGHSGCQPWEAALVGGCMRQRRGGSDLKYCRVAALVSSWVWVWVGLDLASVMHDRSHKLCVHGYIVRTRTVPSFVFFSRSRWLTVVSLHVLLPCGDRQLEIVATTSSALLQLCSSKVYCTIYCTKSRQSRRTNRNNESSNGIRPA